MIDYWAVKEAIAKYEKLYRFYEGDGVMLAVLRPGSTQPELIPVFSANSKEEKTLSDAVNGFVHQKHPFWMNEIMYWANSQVRNVIIEDGTAVIIAIIPHYPEDMSVIINFWTNIITAEFRS